MKHTPYRKVVITDKNNKMADKVPTPEPLFNVPIRVKNTPITIIPTELYDQLSIDKYGEKSDFIIQMVYLQAEYTKNPNTLTNYKYYVIKSQINYLKRIEKLGFFDCKRNGGILPKCYPEGLFTIHFHNEIGLDCNEYDIEFNNPLMEDDEIEIAISFNYKGVIESDLLFHFTWIEHQTKLLLMKISPPEPEINKLAELFISAHRGEKLAFKSKWLKRLELDEKSKSFIVKIEPIINTSVEVRWI